VSTEGSATFELAHIGAEATDVESVYLHATGFCKELWLPIVRRVDGVTGSQHSALLVDQRGHGDSTPFSGPVLWDLVARDLLEALGDVPHSIVGVGHSAGGAAVARAEILSPGTFSTILLIEPIVWPPPFEPRDMTMSARAMKRRRSFDSRDEARNRFASGPFSAWDEEILDLYVDHAFRQDDEGWTLKCEPALEAESYRQAGSVDTWDRLGEIGCRVVVVTGETSSSHQDPYRSILVDQFRDAELVVMGGFGHLVPMEAPTLIADLIAGVLSGQTPDGADGQASGTIA
jgi:pimeloyl-ACP methyl ester carboxylesterase